MTKITVVCKQNIINNGKYDTMTEKWPNKAPITPNTVCMFIIKYIKKEHMKNITFDPVEKYQINHSTRKRMTH